MTRLVLDQGLPRRAAADLRARAWSVEHTGEVGLAAATDEAILDYAAAREAAVVTLDSDFARLLALSQRSSPSLIHIRIPRVTREQLVNLLLTLVPAVQGDVSSGAIVSVNERGARVRRLPIS
jgi:predicted nuclease of predicted toxin-antitoxin system